MSIVLWFHRFRGVNSFMVSCVLWLHRFRGFYGFVVSLVEQPRPVLFNPRVRKGLTTDSCRTSPTD